MGKCENEIQIMQKAPLGPFAFADLHISLYCLVKRLTDVMLLLPIALRM